MNQTQFLLALHLTAGIGKARESRIIDYINEFGQNSENYPWSLAELSQILGLAADSASYQQIQATYQQSLNLAENFLVPFITYFDLDYPRRLREIYQPPLILFYQGNLQSLSLPALAVVGTRQASPYGLQVVRALLPEVIDTGCAIVSGLAKGIDIMAHQVTFASGGIPIGVIGTGLDRVYPRQHRILQEQVSQQGLVLSEYPPGTGPLKGHFPDRNRIIAGLASATLVVEAHLHSGSLITANLALQENRQVLAVPGSILSPSSAGANALIQAGALPVLSASDIIGSVRQLG
ncbi:DNA-processing protein DprA [Fructobacillus ficulneus]|uniref:DNA processing protein n=1 Tax=Fructobacillus ficulneus TaxID=157463 RepID=A0A0K8MIP2_9LACO|nr:DNA-processing protein DprA [Fructobacillus ficulneus]GAP00426.1 DNA processing protein [Fructobacillus ficulneus]